MTYWVETRSTVRRTGKPMLVPLEEIYNRTGFRSVYSYEVTTKDEILAAGSTANLRGTRVYSDILFVDFDGTDSTPFKKYLISHNIAFEQYDSGGRSAHFHIKIEPMLGVDVPARQKAWMKEHAPTADHSFYHPAGMYRLPRTYHAKTSRQKVLLETHTGQLLTIPELTVTTRSRNIGIDDEGSSEKFYIFVLTKKGQGQRSMHLFTTAAAGFKAGLGWDTVMAGLKFVNSRFDEPHQESVLDLQCQGALQFCERTYGNAR